ncbi:phosphodiester glycosidase family protein [Actinomycetospora sp. TBRC 11914]|uniref:phosphodiester glycosidase family protein n=1 Tax=Actinomycetospora sp. TBRC 11914 TaxID=2729387 RepID=UPI00145F531F|nr:phosphodiester glycosidase family protein [Actinomycetospora sp. TBRC 11914]NMO89146.1 phosphodiester glycosidase family protein [Actinomycetospora sp. TBRC 11914]
MAIRVVRPLAGGVAALAVLLAVAPSALAGPTPPPPPPAGAVLDQVLAARGGDVPGTEYREFTTTVAAGRVRGHVVRVDLRNPGLAVVLLRSPVVTATATVPDLAGRVGAIAGVNGDFFDEGGSGAPVGAELSGGVPLTSAVVPGRRPAPPGPPGSDPDTVLGIDASGAARIDTVRFAGTVTTAGAPLALSGLNTYAVPVGGIAAFTPGWGAAPRTRTVCGSDTDPHAPCSPDTVEVVVRDGRVAASGPVGTAAVPTGAVALVGRDRGADALRGLRVGDRAVPHWELRASGTPALRTALGVLPLARGGAPWPGLQDTERAPRTAVGLSADGRTLALVAVDGRQQASVGLTLAQLGRLVVELGWPQAVALDGGGSTQMVRRPAGGTLGVVNTPSDMPLRRVRDGVGVVPAR